MYLVYKPNRNIGFMNQSSKKHFENLDSLRFIAFLFVFLSHSVFTFGFSGNNFTTKELEAFSHLGRIGVDFFFVLSSFLITWIIEEKYHSTENFNARYFLVRRALRIWPLYFLLVFTGYAAIIFQKQFISTHTNPAISWFLLFAINFYIISHGQNFLFFLVFLWSIAIEEQFYLAWAFIMKFTKKYYSILCFLMIIISLVYRYLHLNDSASLYFHTFSSLGNFGIGALTAYISFHQKPLFNHLVKMSRNMILIIYLLLIICICFYQFLFSSAIAIVCDRSIFSFLFALIIFEQCFAENSFIKWGRFSIMTYLGKISYGLYCYHGLAITFIIQLLKHFSIKDTSLLTFGTIPVSILIISISISALSYKYFEKQFLKMKEKFN